MNCKICESTFGVPVPMQRVEHKNREVVGAKSRIGGGWAYKRKTVGVKVNWYCPNSFSHTITEEVSDEINQSDT